MRTFLKVIALLAVVGAVVFWWVTRPVTPLEDSYAGLTGDPAHGEWVFWAGGCASCHAAPGAEGEDRLVLSGGVPLASDFGTFHAPNISPDPEAGIGGWSVADLGNAMQAGVSPGGHHYYPAFPFTTYIRAEAQDIADLHSFLMTLPTSQVPSVPHDVGFPFNIRRELGGWKWLFLDGDWVLEDVSDPVVERGRYIVEALGHCGECHTPRNMFGGLDKSRWLGGAPNPSGQGSIPNITPGGLDWSEGDIAEYLRSGFTPDFDVAGGEMADVVANMAMLSDEDRAAIAAYLKAVPAVGAAAQ
ncbi:c-type cytochrome [Pseudooceanicola sp. LIPI14-2-Ac024]|uniref:c-type cytochrome n=1 Tax=Pseudooceanicola sp. LIPI14-2-Ac024 TaxID=3344875 RepID=UPI0035CEED51